MFVKINKHIQYTQDDKVAGWSEASKRFDFAETDFGQRWSCELQRVGCFLHSAVEMLMTQNT